MKGVRSVGRRRRAVIMAITVPPFVLATFFSFWLGLNFAAIASGPENPVGVVVLAILFGTVPLSIAWRGFVIVRWLANPRR